MIINSKFHDYYDTALAYGVDKTIVLNRHEQVVDTPEVISKLPTRYSWGRLGQELYGFWIGFCGKMYYGERHKVYAAHKPSENTFYFNGEKLPSQKNKRWAHFTKETHDRIAQKDYTYLFAELNVPYFLFQPHHWANKGDLILYPCLEDYGFFKVFDSFSANQAIQQFLTNELAREKELDEPADKYKILAHGMDGTSFKREKGGPTRKRKKLK